MWVGYAANPGLGNAIQTALLGTLNKLLDEEDSDWHDVHGVVVETAIAAVLGHLGGRLDTGKVGDTIAWAALQIDVSISLSLADAIENLKL